MLPHKNFKKAKYAYNLHTCVVSIVFAFFFIFFYLAVCIRQPDDGPKCSPKSVDVLLTIHELDGMSICTAFSNTTACSIHSKSVRCSASLTTVKKVLLNKLY